MTVGFCNAAGTDLDSLFYTDNSNAGAVGFLEPAGQDLGNRYTTASTLGYAVGLVNSAGTCAVARYHRGLIATGQILGSCTLTITTVSIILRRTITKTTSIQITSEGYRLTSMPASLAVEPGTLPISSAPRRFLARKH